MLAPLQIARDLITHLTGENDIDISEIKDKPTWLSKIFTAKAKSGREFELLLADVGEYVLREKDANDELQVISNGHVEDTAVGSEEMRRKLEIARHLTGVDLEVFGRINFSNIGLGQGLMPKDGDLDQAYILVEMPEGKFSIFRSKENALSVHKFEEIPFAEVTEEELKNPDAAFTFTIAIDDPVVFKTEMGGKDIRDLSSSDFVSHLLRPGEEVPETVLQDITCSQIENDGNRISMKVCAKVLDRGELVKAARGCYASCWGDETWLPRSPSEALYELLLASNANPSPDEMGFAIEEMAVMMEQPSSEDDNTPDL